jgi:hypothetical protein
VRRGCMTNRNQQPHRTRRPPPKSDQPNDRTTQHPHTTVLPHAYSISCSVFPSEEERGSFMGVVKSGDREAGGRVRSGCSRREHGAERKRGKGREGGACDNPGRANSPFAQSLIQVRTSCEDTSLQAVKTLPACSWIRAQRGWGWLEGGIRVWVVGRLSDGCGGVGKG